MFKSPALLALLAVSSAYAAQENIETKSAPTIFDYDIFSEGEDIGDISSQITLGPDQSYTILEKSTIEVSSFWGDLNVRSTKSEKFSMTGMLIKANSTVVDLVDKDAYWLKMENNNGELWVSGGQGKVLDQKDGGLGEAVEVATAVATEFIPGLDMVLGVSDFIFSSVQDSIESGTISQNDFTTTFSNLPFYWNENNERFTKKLIVLDTEEFLIDELQFNYVDSRQERFGGNVVTAHHYSVTAISDDEPMEVWLAVDHNGIPFFTEFHVVDEDGRLEVKLKQ